MELVPRNPERVVMAHGEWQQQDGRAYLEKAFAWLMQQGPKALLHHRRVIGLA